MASVFRLRRSEFVRNKNAFFNLLSNVSIACFFLSAPCVSVLITRKLTVKFLKPICGSCHSETQRMKMLFGALCIYCSLIGLALTRPSKVQEDGISSSDEDNVFIMKRTDLRNDWCKTRPFRQTIKLAGCLPAHVMNNYCYGQCNSLYIPSHASQQPLFESCTSCLPQRSVMKTVTLRCPSLPVKFQKHRYLHSKRCRCTSVRRSTGEDVPQGDRS